MKKILLVLFALTLTACAKPVTTEHLVTGVNILADKTEIFVDGNTLLELDKNVTTNLQVGDKVMVTHQDNITPIQEKYEFNDNNLYLEKYQILEGVTEINLISKANPLTKEVIYHGKDENKLIFEDKTSTYSVETITPMKINELTIGATYKISYFKEADTKDYKILSSVYEIKLIDDTKKQGYYNVIYDEDVTLVTDYYFTDCYQVALADLDLGDRVLLSYDKLGEPFKLGTFPYYSGYIMEGAVLEETIIKAKEKTTYKVVVESSTNNVTKVRYNNDVYTLVAENGFEFSEYAYKEGAYLTVYANKDIDQENKQINGVYKIKIEA